MQKFWKKLSVSFAIVSVFFAATIFSGCGTNPLQSYKVDLEIWGFNDDSDTFEDFINEYKRINPHVGDIKYRKLMVDTYRKELLDALAAGNGPDIFLIQNTWLPGFSDKLVPAPQTLITEGAVKSEFVDVVANDFIDEQKDVYALPLTVGSLALFYNKDMLNAAGITTPPKTWNEFVDIAKKMTIVDESGNIVRSGAAFGTASNVNRAVDILMMLMLQNDVAMTDDAKSSARFDQGTVLADGSVGSSGENALQFYTQFAKGGLSSYTWNSRMHYSIDAFYEGNLAMMINYPWHVETIKSKNAKMNFGVAQVPQLNLANPSNYANYWGYAVSKNKIAYASDSSGQAQKTQLPNELRVHESWEFIKFLTMKNNGTFKLTNAVTKAAGDFPVAMDPATEYTKNTAQPGARRDIIETQKNDPVLGPFAYGNLIAKSWYQVDPVQIEGIFADMIDSVNKGNATVHDALKLGSTRVSQIMQSE